MPWQHCDNEKILDDASCPSCGITKLQWTLEWKVTRVFQVGKKKELKLELQDGAGGWLADEPFRVALPDGSVHAGALNEVGYAKVPIKGKGICWVSFPDRPEVEARSDDAVPERTPEGQRFGCLPDGQKYLFVLAGAEAPRGVLIEVLDPTGAPLAHQTWVAVLASGAKREGQTDARGQAWVEGAPGDDPVSVAVPPWFAHDFGPAPEVAPLAPAPALAPEPARPRQPSSAIELELLDPAGAPLAYHEYELVLPDGTLRAGRVDGRGCATLRVERPDLCRVRIPGFYTHDFAPR
ncbi:MAG: hypothetical protein AB7N76_29260 [Planctomycetota bacterium]